ncbi:methionyl-tRNA formyltransferase [Clostridium formicaceticum]|uniref:Methionyl-tRNA formyltransferase n=1 Tax=Clostridium formicaceticum TaxID=1497 RepID=A0AAC9RIX3_9CLOT|nr:methionyl-tRNA formyltransferase [Clostridium formicaceticum]AOY78429.1 methionyl-tRNA formyltransferase [Clostridium formicaceticum]ARE87919.1 Methionyl-tRNA formyltransferase [Clostridium formicaceticum]
MRIVFMGTPDFAVPSLEALVKEEHHIVGVFTQPDRPKGRGKKLTMPPVKEKALENHLEVFQPNSLKDIGVVEAIKEMCPDVIVVVAYGQILTKEILQIPALGCINVHASLLPKYRGAGPIQWAIIHGEKTTGITTMYMEEGLDTGDMILKEEVPIGEDETAGELHDRLALIGGRLLKETLLQIERGNAPREKQKEELSTYAPMLTKELGEIQWHKTAGEIHNLIRGTIPWPMAYTTYLGKIMKIWKSSVEVSNASHQPGKIIEVKKDKIYVGTGKNLLVIEELQFSGGKRLAVKDFLVGNTIEKNILLGKE